MDPIKAIVWVGVAVFAGTSFVALLYLVGRLPHMRKEHGRTLFRILIVEIVTASVAAFGFFISTKIDPDRNNVPVNQLLVVEQDRRGFAIYDGFDRFHIFSPRVYKGGAMAEIYVDTRADFSRPMKFAVHQLQPCSFNLRSDRYELSFVRMGTLAPIEGEQNSEAKDFALVSVRKASEDQPSPDCAKAQGAPSAVN